MIITNRTTHDCRQGTPEWDALRARHFTASEASAMLGVSKYQTRSGLLKRKATGVAEEIDAATQRRFDEGHAAEAAARQIVEGIIGDDLFPVTITADVDGLPLLASMDGLTMLGDAGWETKLLNQDLKADVLAGTLHEHYTVQMEQQLLVSGAEWIYFTASDGTPEGTFGMRYESNPALRHRIVAGWKQFAADIAAYVPEHETETVKPAGTAPDALPALRIEVTGMVTASNLAVFRDHALAVFGGIKTDLQTDADFADAEKTVKWCKEVEDKLDAAKQHALSQTASIDELFRTIDAIKEEARQKRLTLDRLVKAEKENRKGEIVSTAYAAIQSHVAALNARIGGNYISAPGIGVFGEAVKGLKSLGGMRDKVSVVLANAKIETSALAERIQSNRDQLRPQGGGAGEDWISLFPDFAAVCTKSAEDFHNLVTARVASHMEAERRRVEAERERIRQEEEAKVRREAERLAEEERQRIRAEERARLRAEAEARQLAMQEDAAKRAAELQAMADAKPQEPADTGERITLGQINTRLAPIQLTAAGLAQLGIHPAGRERAAVLYREADIDAICAALIRHLSQVSAAAIREVRRAA